MTQDTRWHKNKCFSSLTTNCTAQPNYQWHNHYNTSCPHQEHFTQRYQNTNQKQTRENPFSKCGLQKCIFTLLDSTMHNLFSSGFKQQCHNTHRPKFLLHQVKPRCICNVNQLIFSLHGQEYWLYYKEMSNKEQYVSIENQQISRNTLPTIVIMSMIKKIVLPNHASSLGLKQDFSQN